jgi:alkylated DNA repair protein alkB family protein 8
LQSAPYTTSNFEELTINELKPGSDTPFILNSHSKYDKEIVFVSLSSEVLFHFKDLVSNKETIYVLPKMSILILNDTARLTWKYSILNKKIVLLKDKVAIQTKRLLLCFRSFNSSSTCQCTYGFCTDTSKNNQFEVANDSLKLNPDFESLYVKNVYNSIAEHFSHTRYKPWPLVESFLRKLPKNSLVGDIGCGNGKYIQCVNHLQFIGVDISESFGSICRNNKHTQFLLADSSLLPFRSNVLDFVISIAVVHHFATHERRKYAISELLRVVKVGGSVLIYVWAFEQDNRKFDAQDVFVTWNNQKKFEKNDCSHLVDKSVNLEKNTVVYKRFYHLFRQFELEDIIWEIQTESQIIVKIVSSYYDHENWCIEVMKIK